MKSNFCKFYFILFIFLSQINLFAQNINQTTVQGAAANLPDSLQNPQNEQDLSSLFLWRDSSSALDVSISGFWLADFSSSFLATFGKNTPLYFSAGVPIFKQEVDLSAIITLNDLIFFEVEFAEKFNKNTFTLGYNGKNALKKFMFSNRNIVFPQIYSADKLGYGISGGQNQAPGIYLQFLDKTNNKWQGDFVLRYDMTTTQDATFYGMNSVTDTKIPLTSFLYSKSFILPQASDLSSIQDIYVESVNGTFISENGKRFIKLATSQYLLIPLKNQIILSQDVQNLQNDSKIPEILITFKNQNHVDSIINYIGSYNNPNSYLGKIQSLFSTNYQIDLTEFSYELKTKISDSEALVVQSSQGFSPFMNANLYDCGIKTEGDVFVIHNSSDSISTDYKIVTENTDFLFSQNNFFYDSHLYAQVINLLQDDSSYTEPAVRYPFADSNPFVYLTKNSVDDLSILLRTYSPVNNLYIGTTAVQGSIVVYKNGIKQNNFSYDSASGFITLASTVEQTDKIYIVWQEESNNIQQGAFVAGLGFLYNINPHLQTDISLTTRLPLSFDSTYSQNTLESNGFVSLNAGISYNKDYFSVSNKTSIAVDSPTLSKNLLVNDANIFGSRTYYLSSQAGFTTNVTPNLTNFGIDLKKSNNGTIKNYGGIQDSFITGYKIPLEWDFTSLNDFAWASVDIKLAKGDLLKNSSEFELALQIPKETSLQGYKVFLQLGNNASTEFYGEDSFLPTWEITSSSSEVLLPLDINNKEWQTIKVKINKTTQAKLISNYDARLIVVKTENTIQDSKGIIYVGPYECVIQGQDVQANPSLNVTSRIIQSNDSPNAKKFLQNENYATKINWNSINKDILPNESYITSSIYFDKVDFSSYKEINFDFKFDIKSSISNIYTNNSDFLIFSLISDDFKTPSLELKINSQIVPLLLQNNNWNTLTINLEENQIYLNKIPLQKENFSLKINKNTNIVKQVVSFSTLYQNEFINSGEIVLDNLYLSQPESSFVAKNNFQTEYKNQDAIIKIKNYELLKNVSASFDSTQSIFTKINNSQKMDTNIDAILQTSFTFADIDVAFDAGTAFIPEEQKQLQIITAGHQIKSSKKLFNFVDFNTEYRYSPNELIFDNTNFLKIDFANYNFPFALSLQTDAEQNQFKQNQTLQGKMDFSIITNPIQIIFNSQIDANQNLIKNLSTQTYFGNFEDISKLSFSTGLQNALVRNVNYLATIFTKFGESSFTPTISYNLLGQYKTDILNDFTDTTKLSFAFPFAIKDNSFNILYQKIGGGIEYSVNTKNYIDDSKKLFESFNQKKWIYSSLPFYDLFSKDLTKEIWTNPTQTNFYSALYELSWNRKLFNSFMDILPSSVALAFARDITSGENTNDIYQIKCTLSSLLVNLFGENSKIKLFDWYKQEEISSSLISIFKIPTKPTDDFSYSLSYYASILFYINQNSALTFANDFSIQNDYEWQLRFTSIYSRSASSSPILSLLGIFWEKINQTKFNITRKDSLNIDFSYQEKILSQNYEYLHSTEFNFLQNYTITSGIGTIFATESSKVNSIGIILDIGGKISF